MFFLVFTIFLREKCIKDIEIRDPLIFSRFWYVIFQQIKVPTGTRPEYPPFYPFLLSNGLKSARLYLNNCTVLKNICTFQNGKNDKLKSLTYIQLLFCPWPPHAEGKKYPLTYLHHFRVNINESVVQRYISLNNFGTNQKSSTFQTRLLLVGNFQSSVLQRSSWNTRKANCLNPSFLSINNTRSNSSSNAFGTSKDLEVT